MGLNPLCGGFGGVDPFNESNGLLSVRRMTTFEPLEGIGNGDVVLCSLMPRAWLNRSWFSFWYLLWNLVGSGWYEQTAWGFKWKQRRTEGVRENRSLFFHCERWRAVLSFSFSHSLSPSFSALIFFVLSFTLFTRRLLILQFSYLPYPLISFFLSSVLVISAFIHLALKEHTATAI